MLAPQSPKVKTTRRTELEGRVSVKSVRQLIASKTHIDLDLFFRSPSPGLGSTVTKRPLMSLPASPHSGVKEDIRLPPIPSSKSPSPQPSHAVFDDFDPRVVHRSKAPKMKQIIRALKNVQTYLPPIKQGAAESPSKASFGLQQDGHHKRYRSLVRKPTKL